MKHTEADNFTGYSSSNCLYAVLCWFSRWSLSVFLSGLLTVQDHTSTIFFLFYFNRVFAKIISVALRAYLRTVGGSSVYIDIQSLQISLLAGRVFFGRVRYHGSNETIQIVSGHITWRYWLRKVRHCHGDKPGSSKSNELPSRIAVKLNGLEWFVYNRSPAYDAIWAQMEESVDDSQENPTCATGSEQGERSPSNGSRIIRRSTRVTRDISSPREKENAASTGTDHHVGRNDDSDGESGDRPGEFPMDSFFLRALPVHIDCHRGGVVLGNNNTRTILVAKFKNATGIVDATPVIPSNPKILCTVVLIL